VLAREEEVPVARGVRVERSSGFEEVVKGEVLVRVAVEMSRGEVETEASGEMMVVGSGIRSASLEMTGM